MKKIISTVILSLFLMGQAHATPSSDMMRDLTIDAMLSYARALYERGDYKEAKNVMTRIKELNPDFSFERTAPIAKAKVEAKATVVAKARVVDQPAKTTAKSCCEAPIASVKPAKKIVEVPVDPNADLLEAIAKEDQLLSKLNQDVTSLRQQIQATHHE